MLHNPQRMPFKMHSEHAQRNQQVKREGKTPGACITSHPPPPHPLAPISDAPPTGFFSKPNLENRGYSFFFQDPHCSDLKAQSQSSELKQQCVDSVRGFSQLQKPRPLLFNLREDPGWLFIPITGSNADLASDCSKTARPACGSGPRQYP